MEETENIDPKNTAVIAEEYARLAEFQERQTKLTSKLRAEKNIARKQQQEQEQNNRYSTAMGEVDETEMFKNLGKGDIGESASDETNEENSTDEKMPSGMSDTSFIPGSRRSTKQNGAQNISEQQMIGPTTKGQIINKSQKVIKQTTKESTTVSKEATEINRQLIPVKAAYAVTKTADLSKILLWWVGIVVAAYSTVILGIILTILSIVIVPLIIFAWLFGLLPKSPHSKLLKNRRDKLQKDFNEKQKIIKSNDQMRQVAYQQIARINKQ
jgi:hypothetical protein